MGSPLRGHGHKHPEPATRTGLKLISMILVAGGFRDQAEHRTAALPYAVSSYPEQKEIISLAATSTPNYTPPNIPCTTQWT